MSSRQGRASAAREGQVHYRIVHELSAPPLVDLSRLVLALDHHGRRLDQLIEPAHGAAVGGLGGVAVMHSMCGKRNREKT